MRTKRPPLFVNMTSKNKNASQTATLTRSKNQVSAAWQASAWGSFSLGIRAGIEAVERRRVSAEVERDIRSQYVQRPSSPYHKIPYLTSAKPNIQETQTLNSPKSPTMSTTNGNTSTADYPQPTSLSTVANHPGPRDRSASTAPPTLRPATSPPSFVPDTLHIFYTDTLTTRTAICTSTGADARSDPLYLLDTRIVTSPHVTLFRPSRLSQTSPSTGEGKETACEGEAEGEEIATATFPAHGHDFTLLVRGQGVEVKAKSKLSSAMLFTPPPPASSSGGTELSWKGDRHGLTCTRVKDGREVAKLEVSYPKEQAPVGKVSFVKGASGLGLEETDVWKEVVLATGLAVQELKGRKGQKVWGNMGKGMMLSTGV